MSSGASKAKIEAINTPTTLNISVKLPKGGVQRRIRNTIGPTSSSVVHRIDSTPRATHSQLESVSGK